VPLKTAGNLAFRPPNLNIFSCSTNLG
jgi:hypothetical protein